MLLHILKCKGTKKHSIEKKVVSLHLKKNTNSHGIERDIKESGI